MRSRRGFSLIELTIVILILGILAAIVVPRFTSASDQSRGVTAQTTLQYLRGQINLFATQHNNCPPQNGCLWVLMQRTSNPSETATTNPMGTMEGPYFRADPLNPWNNLTRASNTTADTNAGWYYTAGATTYELRVRNTDGTVNYEY
jgi:general secretion pathway protein G